MAPYLKTTKPYRNEKCCEGFSLDAGKAPVKTALYMGTWCQAQTESAHLTCGF